MEGAQSADPEVAAAAAAALQAQQLQQILSQLVTENVSIIEFFRRENARLAAQASEATTSFALESFETRIKDNWAAFERNHRELLKIPGYRDHEYYQKKYHVIADQEFTKAIENIGALHRDVEALQAAARPAPAVSTMMVQGLPTQAPMKLPNIDLPRFSGDILKWEGFRDQFLALVHASTSLRPAQKLAHLQRSLDGEAAEIIRNMAPTDANYEPAWTALVTRYGNQRILSCMHMKSLIELQPASNASASEIKRVMDFMQQTIRAFEALEKPTKEWNEWFVFFLASKLDLRTRIDWETSLVASSEVPQFSKLTEFLENRLQALQTISSVVFGEESSTQVSTRPTTSATQAAKPKARIAAAAISSRQPARCPVCLQTHQVSRCSKYMTLSLGERQNVVRSKKLCSNCLGTGHFASKCPSTGRCRTCNASHHTSLHQEDQYPRRVTSVQDRTVSLTTSGGVQEITQEAGHQDEPLAGLTKHVNSAVSAVGTRSAVLLATAIVRITGPRGGCTRVRALIDPGADTSFVSQAVVQAVGLKPERVDVSVWGFSSPDPLQVRGQVDVSVANLDDTFSMRITALVKPRLNLVVPATKVRTQNWTHIEGLILADPDFATPARIDVLLGADVWNAVFKDHRIPGPPGAPHAYLTEFGYILLGSAGPGPSPFGLSPATVNVVISRADEDLSNQLQRFWEAEELLDEPIPSPDDEFCERHFCENYYRTKDGRYVVRLPMKQEVGDLLDGTKPRALLMLQKLKEKFSRDPQLESKYREFLDEYLQLGHMRQVSEESLTGHEYYIPHHGVFKNRDAGGKLRVVFNASAKAPSGFSLNSLMHVGKKLQPDLYVVFLRWRKFRKVYSTDIVKFYRQFDMHPSNWILLTIVFLTLGGLILFFQLITNTYGTAAAQWLALRALEQLILDEGHRFPRAAIVARKNRYIDDFLFGADTEEELEAIREELIQFMAAGGMTLAKWASNVPQEEADPPQAILVGASEGVQTLGVSWTPAIDTFAVSIRIGEMPRRVTKRSVLSDISTVFDVLGTKAPVTIKAKIFMQDLWIAKAPWDDELTKEQLREWLTLRSELTELPLHGDARWLGTTASKKLQVHGFSDASSRAYAAAVYFRSEDEEGVTSVLAICKTKVAPLKTISIPKLELAAAHLLARLMKQLQLHLDLQNAEFFAWTDAKVVLAWIKSHPSRWAPFVANRVSQIQQLTDVAIWDYVETGSNPADLATRGMTPEALHESSLWKAGPAWLTQDPASWPRSLAPLEPVTIESRSRVIVSAVGSVDPEWSLLTQFSSLQKLVRIIAVINLFLLNCRQQRRRRSRVDAQVAARNFALTAEQLRQGLHKLVIVTQKHYFPAERTALAGQRRIPARSPLVNLRPFLGSDGCIRVGGRLQRANLDYDERHPVIIPKASSLARLLVEDAHRLTLHGGGQLTHRHLLSNFWIPGGWSLVRSIIHRCVRCTRFRAQPMQQVMAPLPEFRTRPQRPFLSSGVDFAGPIQVKASGGRGQKSIKAYICLFVCLTTKAIHLEAAVDLSTAGFLAAFRRFVSRRGRCAELRSDNGTNFKGASSELKAMFNEASTFYKRCADLLARDGTSWSFIPPGAPHFGGIWEAGVKSTKHHLRRVIGQTRFTFEELSTLLAQIEACLNSRPLTPLSADPLDLVALTPGHFLVGEPLTALPEPPVPDRTPLTRRYLMVTRLRDDFWNRWKTEYLHELQTLTKWRIQQDSLQVGQFVLIKDETSPPTKWVMGRVDQVFPDKEGIVRSAEIRTATGVLTRPIHKLILLPVEDNAT